MRRHISKEMKEMALQMSLESGLGDIEIAEYTGIRPRTLRRIRKLFRETGEIENKPVVSGRPRLLDLLDATVSASPKSCRYISHSFLTALRRPH